MIATVLVTICLGMKCETHRLTAYDVPRLYREMGLWQADVARAYGDQGYRITRVSCEVTA